MKVLTTNQILAKLHEINLEIRQQIPFPANYLIDFSRMPTGLSEDEYHKQFENQSIERQKFHDTWGYYESEFLLYQHFIQIYQNSGKPTDKEKIKNLLLSELRPFLAKNAESIKVTNSKYANYDYSNTAERIEKRISQIVDTLIAEPDINAKKLLDYDSNFLAFDRQYKFAERVELMQELDNLRHIKEKQIIIPTIKSFGNGLQTDAIDHITKMSRLEWGVYWINSKTRNGLCGEYSSIALAKIFSSGLMSDLKTVEFVTLPWLDDNGKEYNNHCFLAINRNPDSNIHDTSTWGKDAIFYDPWNDLLCLASEFKKQPYHYYFYENENEWETLNYTKKDCIMYDSIEDATLFYQVTGKTDPAQRKAILMEEYSLTSIKEPGYESINKLIRDILRDIGCNTNDQNIEIMINSNGSDPIKTANYFDEPTILIQKDYIQDLVSGKISIDGFKFGLLKTLTQLHYYGTKDLGALSIVEEFQNIKSVIEKNKNGQAGIQFYQDWINFKARHITPEQNLLDSYIASPIEQIENLLRVETKNSVLEINIKHIHTYLAENPTLTGANPTKLGLPVNQAKSITSELMRIKNTALLTDGFNLLKTNIEKINYLKNHLADLFVNELYPFELSGSCNIRLSEFINLLKLIHIDLNDSAQFKAADDLILSAFNQKVPGFYYIYSACNTNDRFENAEIDKMLLLGPFRILQEKIDTFIHASNYENALNAARDFQSYKLLLKDQFCESHPSDRAKEFTNQFYLDNKRYPIGSERFFGSFLGSNLVFKGINDANEVTSHLAWSKIDKEKIITSALYELGLFTHPEVTNEYSVTELINNEPMIIGEVIDNSKKRQRLFRTIEAYKKNRPIDKSALLMDCSIAERIDKYVKDNAPYLTHSIIATNEKPLTYYKIFNTREAVDDLLGLFFAAIDHGTEKDKAVVREFFTNEDAKPSLYNFQRNITTGDIVENYTTVYYQFIMEQTYKGKQFDFFTRDDVASFLNQVIYRPKISTIDELIKGFKLNYSSLTLDCLSELSSLANEKLSLYCTGRYSENDIGRGDIYHNIIMTYLDIHHPGGKTTIKTPSRESVVFTKALFNLMIPPLDYMSKYEWEFPNNAQDITLPLSDLIYLYRIHDATGTAPSENILKKFSGIILQKIKSLDNADERISALEQLIFTDKYYIPLSDMEFRNTVIQNYIEEVFKKFNLDDGKNEYAASILPLIINILTNAPGRDKELILSKLVTKIEAQQEVCKYIGSYLSSDKYFESSRSHDRQLDERKNQKLTFMSAISRRFGYDEQDQQIMLDFLSNPLSNQSIEKFYHYLKHHQDLDVLKYYMESGFSELAKQATLNDDTGKFAVKNVYFMFWDLSLEERAVIIDYLLIPANKVVSEKLAQETYEKTFNYVADKLFPQRQTKPSDDDFACEVLRAYLLTSAKYQRSILLAGILVATNEAGNSNISAGKKLALLCEHLGPAYVKLAQAIHSHPDTPENIRKDLDHIKSRANPPPRWDIMRMIQQRLPKELINNIVHVGKLLGSASYNLAMDVKLNDKDDESVLILLRENAAIDAEEGFKHLEATINNCHHSYMNSIRDSLRSILTEAKASSLNEMDKDKSAEQFKKAYDLYYTTLPIKADEQDFTIHFYPARLHENGQGYRIIDKINGLEFNSMSAKSENNTACKAIAKAVMFKELLNILMGGCFDSDRHGDQEKIIVKPDNTILIGLYDFGEMSLTAPNEDELKQFGNVIKRLPLAMIKSSFSFDTAFNSLLTDEINHASKRHKPTHYLMHIRKGLLALHDFQKVLSNADMIDIFKMIAKQSSLIHPTLRGDFTGVINSISKPSVTGSFLTKLFHFYTGNQRSTLFQPAAAAKTPEVSDMPLNKATNMK